MSSQPSTTQDLPMSSPQPAPPSRPRPRAASNPIRDAISEAIAEHKVILFMKGTPEAPACGFSARTVAALQSLDVPFAAVDVLPDPRIRQELSAISDWPTIPQLFANGELVGGCDIVTEMYESGRARARRCSSVPRACPPSRSPPTARTTCRARSRTARTSIRSACTSAGRANPSASWRWTASTPSTSACAAIPSCPRPPSPRSATSSPSGSRCSRRPGRSSRSTSPAASPAPTRPRARRTGCSPSAGWASAWR